LLPAGSRLVYLRCNPDIPVLVSILNTGIMIFVL
jgi:hypothetical protein